MNSYHKSSFVYTREFLFWRRHDRWLMRVLSRFSVKNQPYVVVEPLLIYSNLVKFFLVDDDFTALNVKFYNYAIHGRKQNFLPIFF